LFGDVAVEAAETPNGYTRHGIETVPPLLTRGVLLDVAGWKGQSPLPRNYRISVDELKACAPAEGVEPRAGDVLLGRNGYGALWIKGEEFLQAVVVSKSGSLWAAERGVVAVAADNMSWDVLDERDPETGVTVFGHVHFLTQKGIYIIENVNLEELARDRVH